MFVSSTMPPMTSSFRIWCTYSNQNFPTKYLVNMEDEIEFANVLEATIEGLDEDLKFDGTATAYLNEIEDAQLALRRVDAENEVERRIVTVDQAVVVA